MDTWITFLGWATVVHLIAYLLAALVFWLGGPGVTSFYSRHLRISEDEFRRIWVRLLGQYKILVWTFFIVPYLVLNAMS